METNIVYSKPVTGKNFIGRKNESIILGNLLRQGENVVIYEAPKTGKTSLIQQTFFNMRTSGEMFSLADFSLDNVRTSADFMLRLGSEVLKAATSSPEEYPGLVERYLGGTHFVFDEDIFAAKGQVISLNWDLDLNDMDAVITLPYRMAEDSGQRIYIIIDEFQNVMLTEDGEKLLKTMESIMKGVQGPQRKMATFLFCGSRVNAMKFIFEQKRYFHRQIERVKLSPIEDKTIADANIKMFLSNGKVIDRDLMLGTCRLFRNNVWYINHFCAICNGIAKGYIMESMLEEALSEMIAIHEPRFKAIMADLTTFQICLLRAIMDGYTKFSSAEVIERYNLNSSANVRRLKDALCKKEIVTFSDREDPEILDPLFEYWVGKYFFEIQ
ncbi:MAG: ATP-binding protein [Bacteroidales bacterium]|nr:ATP-binding protein [Bacteroidales bacterium]